MHKFFHFSAVILVNLLIINYGRAYRIGSDPYHRAAFLDPTTDRYHLEWMVSRRIDRVIFNVTVQTTGWILFGFANNGDERTGQDVVIGGVGQDGQAYFSDLHTGRYNDRLESDNLQDYTLESSWQTATHTFLSFSRDLNTCDHQDYPLSENKVTLIWGYGDHGQDSEDANGGVGGIRGSYDIYLRDPEYSPRVIRTNLFDQVPRVTGREAATTQVWTVRRSTRMPSNDTSYLCSIHKTPRLPRKHHMIGFDVTFGDEQSRRHVHHLVVTRCRAPRGSNDRSLFESFAQSGEQQSCFSGSRPAVGNMPTNFCQQNYMVWGFGGRQYFTPDHVGFPFGEDPEEYYMVQVHYDNPNQRSNVIVSINLDFFYTRRLRPNDAGLMLIASHEIPGLPESTLIPPQTPNSRLFGHCSGECTQRMLPKEGITLIATFLHSHISGRQLRLHHFRRNEELPWILYDDNYSNDYQQIRALPRGEVQIYPGDQLTMDCTFDNTWTNGTVLGGYRTRQEMCVAYAVYYNLIPDYSFCRSEIVSPSYRQRFLGVTNVTWFESHLDWVAMPPSPDFLLGKTVTDISDNLIEWDKESRQELQQFHLEHEQVGKCSRNLNARDPEDIQQFLDTGGDDQLVISSDVQTRVDTEDDYSGPVGYPNGVIAYEIAESTCLHRGILNRREN